jgi:putative ABC transport system permease protein
VPMNPWPLVAADLRQNRAGAVAIVLLVALAVALGVAVSAQERALRQGSARAAEKFPLVVGAPGSGTQLVLSSVYLQIAAVDLLQPAVLEELAREPTVRFASPLGFGDNYRGHPVVGVAPAFVEHLAGGALAEGRSFRVLDEVVVGAGVDLPMGATFSPVHGTVSVPGAEEHSGFSYRVVGRLPRLGNPWDRAIVSPIEAVWWVHSLPVGHALDQARLYPAGADGEPDWSAIPLGPPWDAAELPGVPAIVVEPSSFAAGYQLRQKYRSREDAMAVFPAEVLVQLYGLLGDVRDLVAVISRS